MYGMFWRAYSFNCNLNKWDISSVKEMSYLFIEADSFDKNNMRDWNLEHVEDKDYMFD